MSHQDLIHPKVGRAGLQDRGEFLRTLAVIAGGCSFLPLVGAGCAATGRASREAPMVSAESITYPGHTGPMRGHLAAPAGDERLSAVVVIHENRGLTPHIRDVTERVAAEGFLALAPDALSPAGGTPSDADQARAMIGQLNSDDTVRDFLAAVQYLKTHRRSSGKVGCVGFCWGGAMANQLAVHSPDLVAAVPYYGRPPAVADVPRIRCALLLHYAGLDERINAGIPAFEEALKAAGVDYQQYLYEGAQHAFNNDSNSERYHPEAARLAWQRTIAFLRQRLRT
ncbi:MAG: dienelactone hydrolase family protein [Candidatus Latescibacterota bacterium]|jgi:carboxymethylenebutenolidase